jgi:phosphatidate cytidylyltransferase
MLIKRVITAVVLLGILAVDLSLETPWPLLIFFSVAVAVTAFEWLRLTLPGQMGIASALGLLLGLGTLWQAHVWLGAGYMDLTLLHIAVVLSSVIWLTAIPAKLWTAQIHHQPKSILWSAFAPICLYATWGALALFWINEGAWSLLSLLLVIWIADILAYFGGKRFGKNKLAPNISPGKTREGALFGLAGVLIWMLITAQFDNSYAFWLQQAWGWVGLVFGSLLLGVLAIMGDLFESYLKRQANVKDSSRLLPGHGGVYDRVDAVVAVVPVAYLLISDFWFR